MKNFKLAFQLWFYIAALMSLVIFASFLLFVDIMEYTYYFFFYMKEIFIGIFTGVIIISFFVVNAYFDTFNIKVKAKTKISRYFKIYWGVLWRALVILIPIVGFIASTYHGSIQSRIATIIIEILVGFPAIWWFLAKINK